jgi:hypothetical protein
MITRSSNFIGRDLVKQLEQNEEFEKLKNGVEEILGLKID